MSLGSIDPKTLALSAPFRAFQHTLETQRSSLANWTPITLTLSPIGVVTLPIKYHFYDSQRMYLITTLTKWHTPWNFSHTSYNETITTRDPPKVAWGWDKRHLEAQQMPMWRHIFLADKKYSLDIILRPTNVHNDDLDNHAWYLVQQLYKKNIYIIRFESSIPFNGINLINNRIMKYSH